MTSEVTEHLPLPGIALGRRRPSPSLAFALGIVALATFPRTALAHEQDKVVLNISIAGTRVLVDGRKVFEHAGQVAVLRLGRGYHSLRIERPGFQTWTKEIKVPQRPARIDVLLAVEPPPPPAPVAALHPKIPTKVRLTPPPLPEPAAKVIRPIRVAIYRVKVLGGVEPRLANVTTDALLAEVRKLSRISAIGMQEIAQMLTFEERRELMGCSDTGCMAEISGAMGVDEIVTATLANVGKARLFTLRRIDIAHARVIGSVVRHLVTGNGDEVLAAIGPAIAKLYPEYPLRPGLTRGVPKAVAEELNPPPLPRVAFYATAGTAVAAALVGGYFGLRFEDAQSQHNSLVQRAQTEPVSAADLQSADRQATSQAHSANVALAIAGGLAVAAGIEALFTDWHGYREEASASSTAAVAARVVPAGVMVTWR